MRKIKSILKGSLITLLIAMGLTLNLSPAPLGESKVTLIQTSHAATEDSDEVSGGSGGASSPEEAAAANANNAFQDNEFGLTAEEVDALGANSGEVTDEEKADAQRLLDAQQGARQPAVSENFLEDVAQLVTQAHYLLSPAIFFFTNHIGTLLGNDYIFAGEMGIMLNTIWIVARNIVNIVFVLILLFMAIRHIFGSQGEGGIELKKALPKFVIMLVAINFSWLASRVVLDAANIATNVVFAIPSGVKGVVGDTGGPCVITDGKANENCMPGRIYFNADATQVAHYNETGANVTIEGSAAGGEECPTLEEIQADPEGLGKKRIFCWRSLDYARFSKSNAAYYLSYGLARVQNLVRANTGDVNPQGLTKAGIGFLFSFILIGMYMLAMFIMFIVLIARYAMLWLFVGFSPFLILIWYLKDFNFQGDEKFSVNAFIQWAFVPVKIGAVFSVGFIMISTGQRMNQFFLSTTENAGGEQRLVLNMKAIFQGMDNIQEFLWLTMTVVIIWFGIFWAVSKLEAIQPIIQGIKNYATGTARLAGRAAYAAPIIPLGEGKKASFQEMVGQVSPREKLKKYVDKSTQQIIDRDSTVNRIKNNSDQMNTLKTNTDNPSRFVSKLNQFGLSNAMLAQADDEKQLESVMKSFGQGWEGNTNLIAQIRDEIRKHKGEKITIESERKRAEMSATAAPPAPVSENKPAAKPAKPPTSGGMTAEQAKQSKTKTPEKREGGNPSDDNTGGDTP